MFTLSQAAASIEMLLWIRDFRQEAIEDHLEIGLISSDLVMFIALIILVIEIKPD